MFNNVNVGSADATISTKWTWNYIPGNPLPKCSYFSCCLKEDVFLNKSLFLEKEILDYFEKEVLKVIGSDREAALKMYNMKNPETSRLIECELRDGDSITKEISIGIESGKHDRVYYICVFDGRKYEARIVSTSSHATVEIKKTPASFFHKYNTIEIVNPDSRRKVLECKCGNAYSYSVLPQGYNKFYFSPDTNLDSVQIKYLSMLMGSTGTIKH